MSKAENIPSVELNQDNVSRIEYPEGLVEWGGHRSGGVRKPFYKLSGRPCNKVIVTPLLIRLRNWAKSVAERADAPSSLLLVGGPGNGKSEAVEDVVRSIDDSLNLNGSLIKKFEEIFSGQNQMPIPRLVSVPIAGSQKYKKIHLVQDASSNDVTQSEKAPSQLLVEDLLSIVIKDPECIYIACVNRGILDDALTFATEANEDAVQKLLEKVTRSVGLDPAAPSCWPLQGYPNVAVWPMDVETLIWIDDPEKGVCPAENLLSIATDENKWPEFGSCAAGDKCPFCLSGRVLRGRKEKESLLHILRWFELSTGKRWSFRDLSSLISFIFSGTPDRGDGKKMSPCEWAAKLIEIHNTSTGTRESLKLRVPFILVGALYQHALFCTWPKIKKMELLGLIKELDMTDDPGLMGLHYFLSTPEAVSRPSTLKLQLDALSSILDPALVNPSHVIKFSNAELQVKQIDTRFSQSVSEGLKSVEKKLNILEKELLNMLAKTDEALSSSKVRLRRPAAAIRAQNIVRDFCCRLVKRSLGARYGFAREHNVLLDFENLIAGNEELLNNAIRQVAHLINANDKFVVSLNSTFGEPHPPRHRRAILEAPRQKVRGVRENNEGRPPGNIRFLSIGEKKHPLALTYELFRSVRELEEGMLAASLPRSVEALLDLSKAKISGSIVRDEERLDEAEIRIGNRNEIISREFDEFVVHRDDVE